jgi:2-polyprenyl-3-methyl-5-hydroxy-6-metoxy-1,4-benzoquinol methylase
MSAERLQLSGNSMAAVARSWLGVGIVFDFPAAYDELNAADDDYRFYAELADQLNAASVIDLGCGTGTLARVLAAAGHGVVAIDPDPACCVWRPAKRRAPASIGGWATAIAPTTSQQICS